ncbi:hypothetical protein F5Y17DRAFT_454123 [Xylariaceae sp. FL0594]|nr:hypothetical protein F5Y17DRAFT_454123 [Xylariaceae sp. FL0594]
MDIRDWNDQARRVDATLDMIEGEGGGGGMLRYEHETEAEMAEDEMANAVYSRCVVPERVATDPSKDIVTFGVELEFLLVQCPKFHLSRSVLIQDPHPNDKRWCSTKMQEWEMRRAKRVMAREKRHAEEKSQWSDGSYGSYGSYESEEDTEMVDVAETESAGRREASEGTGDNGGVQMEELESDEQEDYWVAAPSHDPSKDSATETEDTERWRGGRESHVSVDWGYGHPHYIRRNGYTRAKLTRTLRDRGLTVIKVASELMHEDEETNGHVQFDDFSMSEPSDDEREEDYPNLPWLGAFQSTYQWSPAVGRNKNFSNAVGKWERD